MPDEVSLDDRPLGTRYRIDEPDGSWWELGWDRPLGTFYAQQYRPEPYDPFTHDNLVAWYGARPTEISSIAALATRLPLAIPEDIAHELSRDAESHPHLADPPFLHVAQAIDAAAPQPILEAASGSRTTLPAGPLTDALQLLRRDPHLAADDLPSFARGLGLDPAFAQAVIDGNIRDLDVDNIAHVCEALRCSPYDIWGAKLGREILDVYGPERWPRHIEPLDDGRDLSGEDTFIQRRVEQQAADLVSVANPGRHPVSVALDVTPFRQTAVLAVDEQGRAARVTDTLQPADPSTEYHFAYQRLGEPQRIVLPITAAEFAAGCPAGHDVIPALADAASDLDRLRPGADMLRFTDPLSGTDQWIGRETPFDPWQSWDDPRTYYPGDPSVVLSTGPGELDQPLPFTPPAHAELDTGAELDGIRLDF